MPIYEYECENCGVRFDRLQSMQADPVRQCPECSGQVHKVMHAAGIIFKGSGWYITDSKKSTSSTVTGENKTEPKAAKTDQTDQSAQTAKTDKPATAEAKSETKAEVKPESKSETKERA